MKKTFFFVLVISLLTLSLLTGQQQPAQEQEDPFKNFSIVDETQPAPEKVREGFESITSKDAVNYLKFISSDLLEGRDTASPGYDIAAHYAASLFEKWGIKPAGDLERPRRGFRRMMMAPPSPRQATRTYFQNIAFWEILGSESSATVEWQKGQQKKSKSYKGDVDFSYSSRATQTLAALVVFVGYGIQEPSLKFDEYKNLDVSGKFVMMLSEAPGKNDPESPFNKGELKEKYYPQRRFMMRRGGGSPKMTLPRELGAVGILMVENSPEENPDIARQHLDSQVINDERIILPLPRRRLTLVESVGEPMAERSIPTIRISRQMADDILELIGQDIESLKAKIEQTMTSQSMTLPGVTLSVESKVETKLVNSMNVLGYIEGSDPELKNEAIVIGAHLDHLGRNGDYIFNGADDDGSGSVGVMEIAEAFAKNPDKPKRSVVFALWTGEEKGLYGSSYYVAHPFIAKTACNLNLDMISRAYTPEMLASRSRFGGAQMAKEVLEKLDANKYVSFTFDIKTPEIGEAVRKYNNFVGLHINITATEQAPGGSDHAPFARADLPWGYFDAAMTEDYHQPSDTVDKISPDLLEKVIRITFLTAFELANR